MDSPEKQRVNDGAPLYADGASGELADHKDDIFFAAIELTRMPIIVTDPRQADNPIVFANRAFISMTGYDESQIMGANCRFLQGPATDRASVTVIREAIAAREQVQIEILNYRKDGSSFWNALFISPVYNKRKELVYFFASQLDVSRRRDAEEGLAQAQKMEALGQLTGGISHDFNNLLHVMSGHLELLDLRMKRGQVEPAQLRSGIDSIRNAVAKAGELTQQLLAFSRKQSLRGRVLNLNAIVKGMREFAGRSLGETVTVEFDLDPSIGNCQVDPTQLEIALLNVMVNARDAMPAGGSITLRTQSVDISNEDAIAFMGLPAGRYVALSVADTGTGIDGTLLKHVMEPFYTTKDEGKGTGLGLSMVYGFVKQSGGTVTIDSQLGVGTTIKMFFPTVRHAVKSPADVPVAPVHRGGNEHILVVEDRDEVAALAQEMLTGLGYTVTVANDALKALNLVRADLKRYDLLFSDVVMPGGMNGYVLAREVQKLMPAARVLLTTGYDRDLGSVDSVAPMEFEIIKKPYRTSELARRIRMALDGPTGTQGASSTPVPKSPIS